MSQPYVGEVKIFGGNFAPVDYAFCNGALLPISQYDVVFNLIGTTYGGDGQTTFGLPNLQGRVPVGQGTSGQTYVMGQMGGSETVTITVPQLPSHTHTPQASTASGNLDSPGGNVWAESVLNAYSSDSPTVAMSATATNLAGGSQPHDNMPPFLAVTFIIALFGVFPSQN